MSKNNTSFKQKLLIIGQFIAIITFITSAIILANDLLIQPYHSKKVIEKTQQLYKETLTNSYNMASNKNNLANDADDKHINNNNNNNDNKNNNDKKNNNDNANNTNTNENLTDTENILNETINNDQKRDSQGKLLKFSTLLNINNDVKGWISIENTNINYPVLQSDETNPEYYLTRNIHKKPDKCGSIFIDVHSSVERNTKNIVLHGHNMTSTDNMFHYLPNYKKLDYYQQHPIISFDTIYQPGNWKIISIFITDASKSDDFFNYLKSEFIDDSDFLNFVYQLKIRSVLNCPVDVKEDDQLLTLSTCSYELDNYRTVIVARKVREEETTTVDIDLATKNEKPLYPKNFYDNYGGEPPVVLTFEEALKKGKITWYK